jgi:cell division protein ZapA
MGSVDVTILGQKYTIKGDASEEHIKKLALFVNGKLQDVYSMAPGISPLKAAILVSMNIAEELHRLQEEQEQMTRNIDERADVLTSLFD